MKILHVGPIFDQSGYSEASIKYALALDSVGVDVVVRPIKLNNERGQAPDRIHELIAKPSAGSTVVIQHALPSLFDFNGRLKNIGLFAAETSGFRRSGWVQRLNAMDDVWVVNRQQAEATRNSGVERPIHVLPHACDPSDYDGPFKEPDLPFGFSFYNICELNRRKNLTALLLAFHTEFDVSEPVNLVLKVSRPGVLPAQAVQEVREASARIRRDLNLGPDHKQEIIFAERMTRPEILGLHAACDCYVSPSHGEAWGLGAFDAMAMGKTPVVTNWGGFVDYVSESEGYLVNCRLGPCSGVTDYPGLYTSRDSWADVDVRDLMRGMRTMYEGRDLRAKKAAAGKLRARDFSLQAVGRLMVSAILGSPNAKATEDLRLVERVEPEGPGAAMAGGQGGGPAGE